MTAPRPERAPACPVCCGTSIEIYLDGSDRPLEAIELGSSRQRVSPGRILRCTACRFGFRQARSTPEELAELYRGMDTSVYESEIAGRERTARRHLGIVQRHARPGRLLDVGCASGLFLARALEAGWDVTGVEPSETLYARARANLGGRGDIRCATLEEARLSPGFDAITLWDVLEHVPDPFSFLRAGRDLLADGGHLFLNVPDLDSLHSRLFGARWPLLLAEHLNYFTRPSLRLCGERAGLTLVRFGRRPVSFSVEYIAYRLAQHRIPGARTVHKIAGPLGRVMIPAFLGETWAVWRR
jgi:SAM-dependent methyltransferase